MLPLLSKDTSTAPCNIENQKGQSSVAKGKSRNSNKQRIDNKKQISPTQLANNQSPNSNKYSNLNSFFEISENNPLSLPEPTHQYPFTQQHKNDYGDPTKVEPVLGQIFGNDDVSSSSEANYQQVECNSKNAKSVFMSSSPRVHTNVGNEISNCVSSSYAYYNPIDNQIPVNRQIVRKYHLPPPMVFQSASTGSYGVDKSQKSLPITKGSPIAKDQLIYPADKVTSKKNISKSNSKKTLSDNHKQKLTPLKAKGRRKRSSTTSYPKKSTRNLQHSRKDLACNTCQRLSNQASVCFDQAEVRPLSSESVRLSNSCKFDYIRNKFDE